MSTRPALRGLLYLCALTSACNSAEPATGAAPATSAPSATAPSAQAAPAMAAPAGAAATVPAAPAASAPQGPPAPARAASSAANSGATAAAAGSGGAGPANVPDGPAAGASTAAISGGAGAPAAGVGAAGQAGASDAAGAAAMPVPGWQTREDLGKGDGSDVITIGDSWMDYIGGGGGIQAGLDRAGTRYRHYALSGTTLLTGQIPSQYTQAKRSNPKIATVLMTGGGNDIMFTGGCNTAEACEASVKMLIEGFDKLWTEMADDGVKDVVLVQYSADAGTAPKGTRPKMVEEAAICKTGRIFCHYLATTDLVMGQLVDGIHPTAGANDRIAKALLQMMEQRKMRR